MLSDTELTKRAAEGMGWHYWDFIGDYDGPTPMFAITAMGHFYLYDDQMDVVSYSWDPLTDWRAAGEIVDKMRADGWEYSSRDEYRYIKTPMDMVFKARFRRGYGTVQGQESGVYYDMVAPRAITIAYLLARKLITEADLS